MRATNCTRRYDGVYCVCTCVDCFRVQRFAHSFAPADAYAAAYQAPNNNGMLQVCVCHTVLTCRAGVNAYGVVPVFGSAFGALVGVVCMCERHVYRVRARACRLQRGPARSVRRRVRGAVARVCAAERAKVRVGRVFVLYRALLC
jgi:hypothetical protein